MSSHRGRRFEEVDPLDGIEWVRALDQEKNDGEICSISEQGMLVLRVAPISGLGPIAVNSRIYIGNDPAKRDIFSELLGFSRIRSISSRARLEMPVVIEDIINDDEEGYISRFFNRAGNLSLKKHAFELLQGVGNRKALDMVAARGREGFKNMADLEQRCGIAGAELLAQRFVIEIEDKKLQPRLCELISRSE
jgi:predicted nucleic acid-binding OB-fold protein